MSVNYSDWMNSYGDDNACDNPGNWNYTGAGVIECTYFCTYFCSTLHDFKDNKKIDVFDAVRALGKLANENVEIFNVYCSDKNDGLDLKDVINLMQEW